MIKIEYHRSTEDEQRPKTNDRRTSLLTQLTDLQRLFDDLINTHIGWKTYAASLNEEIPQSQHKFAVSQSEKQQKKKSLFNLFGREFSTARSIRVAGLYLYGGSGCGKSFLSDMFFSNLPIEEKKRVHFHEFMGGIHAQLFQLQKEKKGFDPLTLVAQRTAKKTRLLFLDELQVTDVADASILKRLFERLINNELVLLTTTNRPPQDLYKDGHQRQFFVPFIDFIKENCVIRKQFAMQHSIDSLKDYRYSMQVDENYETKTYLHPIDGNSEKEMKAIIKHLTHQTNPYFTEQTVEPIQGRQLTIPKACNLVCIYNFNELMENTMGDSDFRAICKAFKAVIIRNMRKIGREQRNIANRLIKLFDQAYFRNVQIYIEAKVSIEELITPLPEEEATTQEDFAMIRCKSRLIEFQTVNYKSKVSYVEKKMQGQHIQDDEDERKVA